MKIYKGENAVSQERIDSLSARFSRWTKEGNNGKKYDRIYFNATDMGLECKYYNTGNIAYAELDGVKISNSRAREFKNSKAYYDIVENEICIDEGWMNQYFSKYIQDLVYGDGDTCD